MSNPSNFVFVLDAEKKPLTPCRPSMARRLLTGQKAAVFRLLPFTIILKKQVFDTPQPMTLKLDPGSKTTGIALLKDNQVVFGAELSHRGQAIKNDLETRRNLRHSRRNRKTRYRKARFLNRNRPKCWLAPSLQHRVDTTFTWVNRLVKFAPVKAIAQELVRFDLQQLENPEVSGLEYQQGELLGYEIREYLLNKWERKCTYCKVENVPLQVEHIHPKSKGGSNRISNLCLACEKCNQKKGTRDIKDFLAKKPDLLKQIMNQTKKTLKDAAAVNSTRWALFNKLKETGLPVSTGSGGLTKFNRFRLELPKAHWLDAACVGKVEKLIVLTSKPLLIKAMGWGSRQMVPSDKFGFPRKGYKPKQKPAGWATGDVVSVVSGKHEGVKLKRLKTVRFKGNFDIRLSPEQVISVNRKDLRKVFSKDGYSYNFG